MDLAGIDILAAVARDLAERLAAAEQPAFALPPVVEELVARGWTGAKSGRGFYQKTAAGEIQALDFPLMEYRPSERPRFPSIDAARSIDDPGQRIRALFGGKDKVGEFLRATLAPTLLYAARIAGEVAGSRDDIDRAMRWGFGWELGPFETLRAIGVDAVVAALGDGATAEARDLLDGGGGALGRRRVRRCSSRPAPATRVVRKNAGASLVDLGDGVLCVEFHSKMNAIGGDTIEMLRRGVKEAAANFAALVVGNDALHFSAGANLMLLLLEAQEGNWDEVDLMVRAFQGATMGLRYADVPVVVAPAGLTLGGGCEIVLHADRVQAAGGELHRAGRSRRRADSRRRRHEGDAGAGDGRAAAGRRAAAVRPARVRDDRLRHASRRAARTPDGSATCARATRITMNRDRLLADAKTLALSLVGGYVPPQPRSIPVGGANVLAALKLGVHLAWRAGRISDHDALIGRKLAWILAGGDIPAAATLSEQQLLDLEREAFLSLCGERKTQERIAHTLKTGKPLRN